MDAVINKSKCDSFIKENQEIKENELDTGIKQSEAIHFLEQNPDKIDWKVLSTNPNAIHLLEQNPDKINWDYLSENSNAIYLLEENLDKVDWDYLSENPNAIHLLEQNPYKINWYSLVKNPNAIHLLEQNRNKIEWNYILQNPSILEIDYQALQQRIEPFKEELIQKCFHPVRLVHYLEVYNYDIGEDEYQD